MIPESGLMIAVRKTRSMLLVAAGLLLAWALGFTHPQAASAGIHLLLIAAVAVALAAIKLGWPPAPSKRPFSTLTQSTAP
jgi:hypothetical protein